MNVSLRSRILFAVLPQLVLLAILGGAAVVLLHRLGGNIDAIMRENYDSVLFMQSLKEALERIDSSFTFALADQEIKARQQYAEQWPLLLDNVKKELGNITLPGEDPLAKHLSSLVERYQQAGDAFYRRLAGDPNRRASYFHKGGLLDTFKELKDTADAILHLNQDNMEQESKSARLTAGNSLIGFGVALVLSGGLSVWLIGRTLRAILQPIQLMTQSTLAIGAGNLDQVVPVTHHDELGQLAESFNNMAQQLRHYRRTDYARLLRAQRTGQATIDSFPHPVLVVDPDGKVELANPAAQKLLGVAPADATVVVPWQPPESLREPLRQALKEQLPFSPEQFDQAIQLREGGQEKSYLPRITPIRDPYGYTLGAAVLLENVTRFRLLDQIKSNLVATASHELKTPLASIRLAHHVLLEEKVGTLNPKQTELLIDARENSERLLEMVNNLLDLARLEKGREHLDFQPETPENLLRTAAEAIMDRARDKGVAVNLDIAPELPKVRVDAQRLGHALGNLLDNALTYTDRGGQITLVARLSGESVILSVADSGVGIPAEYLGHVFERFSRIPDRSRGTGTGLGLAIVREIIAAHDGTVSCESGAGKGSVFRIELPICQSTPHAPREEGRSPK
jgi:two-component system, NtrC family, sensor histidine kinase KinB